MSTFTPGKIVRAFATVINIGYRVFDDPLKDGSRSIKVWGWGSKKGLYPEVTRILEYHGYDVKLVKADIGYRMHVSKRGPLQVLPPVVKAKAPATPAPVTAFPKYGERFPTGVGKNTIPNPARLKNGVNATYWEGTDLDAYPFKPVMSKHYAALKQILLRNGLVFEYLGVCSYDGITYYTSRCATVNLVRFVAVAPGFLWEKYEGNTPGGGQNHVYVAGKRIKLSKFLAFGIKTQDQLLKKSVV